MQNSTSAGSECLKYARYFKVPDYARYTLFVWTMFVLYIYNKIYFSVAPKYELNKKDLQPTFVFVYFD